MISNSGAVTKLIDSFKLRLSVMQSSFSFTNLESIAIPATGFVAKERLNSSASALKNNPEIDFETIKLIDTRFQPAFNSIAMGT